MCCQVLICISHRSSFMKCLFKSSVHLRISSVSLLSSSLHLLDGHWSSMLSLCFTNVFFQSAAHLYIFLMVSFNEKFYILIEYDLSFFSFMIIVSKQ